MRSHLHIRRRMMSRWWKRQYRQEMSSCVLLWLWRSWRNAPGIRKVEKWNLTPVPEDIPRKRYRESIVVRKPYGIGSPLPTQAIQICTMSVFMTAWTNPMRQVRNCPIMWTKTGHPSSFLLPEAMRRKRAAKSQCLHQKKMDGWCS